MAQSILTPSGRQFDSLREHLNRQQGLPFLDHLSPARVEALTELGYADAERTLQAAWAQDAAQQAAAFLDYRRADAVRELDEPLEGRQP